MNWTPLHSRIEPTSLIEPRVLSQGEIPVLVKATGTYPIFIAETGESSRECPHVEVSLAETFINGSAGADRYIENVYVNAIGGSHANGQRKVIPAVRHLKVEPARTVEEIQALLTSLAPYIAEALDICPKIDDLFEQANKRTSVLSQVGSECDTREGYEALCLQQDVPALADDVLLDSYGLEYGVFAFPEYEPETIVKIGLARLRRRALKRAVHQPGAQEQDVLSGRIEPAGQLWEPCSQCSREPVYLPLHLCKSCWPAN